MLTVLKDFSPARVIMTLLGVISSLLSAACLFYISEFKSVSTKVTALEGSLRDTNSEIAIMNVKVDNLEKTYGDRFRSFEKSQDETKRGVEKLNDMLTQFLIENNKK